MNENVNSHDTGRAVTVLTLNTLAFTVCFACWMLNGVLVTYLVEAQAFRWTDAQVGWLIGIPVLTGSVLRLPAGIATDKFGGRIVFPVIMLLAAASMFLLSMANGFWSFFGASLGFGVAGSSFAVGVAYTSLWFRKERQGTALGIFGAGNLGAALTSMMAPGFLGRLTNGGEDIEGWRALPKYYAVSLVVMAIAFVLFTHSRKADAAAAKGIAARLAPLRNLRVWRFGLYYFLTFGGFVGLAQWLIPYYVNVYTMTVATAGLMASIFSLPSGAVRALGGILSDRFGARRVMYVVLSTCVVCFTLLIVPRMVIESPGRGVMAKRGGVVKAVTSSEIVVDEMKYPLNARAREGMTEEQTEQQLLIWPHGESWQEPIVHPNDAVKKKQLLARGVTQIYFQANVWVFAGLVLVAGFMMGVGNAAIYKHIPDYFPKDVGVVGGIVGVIGGLGGFFSPILFGYLLQWTGIWTTCWMFFAIFAVICLVWMHRVIQQMLHQQAPALREYIEPPIHNGPD